MRVALVVLAALSLACAAPPVDEPESAGATEISGAQPPPTTSSTTTTADASASASGTTSATTTSSTTTGDDPSTTTGDPGYCGDKIVQPDEECDDGSGNGPTAACLPDCRANVCGDGEVHLGVEGCDDGEANGDDAKCTSICTKNVCGDGFRLKYIEACDHGEANGDDAACTSLCEVAYCGDGLTRAGVEECDDGNYEAGDGCTPECLRTNVLFVTDATFTGDLGGVAGADEICREAAKFSGILPWAGPELTYRAWIADPDCPPRERLPHSQRAYVRVDGFTVADDWDDLVDGKIGTVIACTETYNYLYEIEEPLVWTAVAGDGSNLDALPSRSCHGWTLAGDFFFGGVGAAKSSDAAWTRLLSGGEERLLGCHKQAHLYCAMIHCDEFPEACAPDYCGK